MWCGPNTDHHKEDLIMKTPQEGARTNLTDKARLHQARVRLMRAARSAPLGLQDLRGGAHSRTLQARPMVRGLTSETTLKGGHGQIGSTKTRASRVLGSVLGFQGLWAGRSEESGATCLRVVARLLTWSRRTEPDIYGYLRNAI